MHFTYSTHFYMARLSKKGMIEKKDSYQEKDIYTESLNIFWALNFILPQFSTNQTAAHTHIHFTIYFQSIKTAVQANSRNNITNSGDF